MLWVQYNLFRENSQQKKKIMLKINPLHKMCSGWGKYISAVIF